MGRNYYASSPTLVLPPQQPSSHYFANISNLSSVHQHQSIMKSDIAMPDSKPIRPRVPRPPSLNYLATSPKLAGRKRSRDDSADPHEDELPKGAYIRPIEPPKPRGEPSYGPGMSLIYPDEPGFNIAAESQTGTWAEEKHEQDEAVRQVVKPKIVTRKSQRTSGAALSTEAPQPSTATRSMANAMHSESSVDQLSLILGIGWKRLPVEQAEAVRGWECFIRNHYAVVDPTILLYNEGLHAYLVRSQDTQDTFWLFQDDLTCCQLVGATEEIAIANLRQQIPNTGPTIPAQARPLQTDVEMKM